MNIKFIIIYIFIYIIKHFIFVLYYNLVYVIDTLNLIEHLLVNIFASIC